MPSLALFQSAYLEHKAPNQGFFMQRRYQCMVPKIFINYPFPWLHAKLIRRHRGKIFQHLILGMWCVSYFYSHKGVPHSVLVSTRDTHKARLPGSWCRSGSGPLLTPLRHFRTEIVIRFPLAGDISPVSAQQTDFFILWIWVTRRTYGKFYWS